jgi:hypothetical protein
MMECGWVFLGVFFLVRVGQKRQCQRGWAKCSGWRCLLVDFFFLSVGENHRGRAALPGGPATGGPLFHIVSSGPDVLPISPAPSYSASTGTRRVSVPQLDQKKVKALHPKHGTAHVQVVKYLLNTVHTPHSTRSQHSFTLNKISNGPSCWCP